MNDAKLWGGETDKAIDNFPVSGQPVPAPVVHWLGRIKAAAARTNSDLGLLDQDLADRIAAAGDAIGRGEHDDQFPIDVFQTGSGTSTNMNTNEVIANLAGEGVHPNDHVNMGQSSNDVIPAAIHLADRLEAESLKEALAELQGALEEKAEEFRDVIKIGRTHLQDAVPMTLGQEFSAFAEQVRKGGERLAATYGRLEELALGGTAVGTGLNAHPKMAARVIERIARRTGIAFRQAGNLFEAIATRDAQVELMGALNTMASGFMKIANDLRLLASGPRAGFGEIILPSLQPGSSIMPGKVNPVIPEMVIQVVAFIMGKHLSVTIGAQNGPLQLNMMNPLIAYETLTSLTLLRETCRAFADRCIRGIEADRERCAYWVEWSLALVTPLATRIGYDRAAALAYRAFRERRSVREVAREEKVLPEEELERLLDPKRMIYPQDKDK